jgi:TonB family protein
MLSLRYVSSVAAVAASILLLYAPVYAQQVVATAIDAAGKRHFESRELPGPRPQKFVMPVYSHGDRLTRRQGVGLFRMYIDLKTGFVTQVAVVKSTGWWSLDTSAVNALRKWRWKPGTWKEVDVPVRFVIGAG